MYTIRLMNEYLHGPIWVLSSDGIPVWDPPLIRNDATLKELNDAAMKMFSNYYEFDSHGVACWFNHEKQKAEKEQMLSLIQKIRTRLDEINDGSFTVEDCVSEELKQL